MHRRSLSSFCLAIGFALGSASGALAQVPAPAPLYDPSQLPAFHGQLQSFTLTPVGEIDGFVLTDDTEVKVPPHLTDQLMRAVKPGDRLTVHGLKAASLPLIQAMSVTNDATGAEVVDTGPPPGRSPPRPLTGSGSVQVLVHGRLRMLLHGPRGDVNGALLDDGTELTLPPPEAVRFAAVLVPGATVAAQGLRRVVPAGSFIDLQALGSEAGPLRPVAGTPRSDGAGVRPAPTWDPASDQSAVHPRENP